MAPLKYRAICPRSWGLRSSMPALRSVEVSPAELRAMFDADRIENRHAIGELSIIVLKSHDARPELHMPPGTLSQLVAYVDGAGNHLAVAHRYLKPDGTLAASGRPDPKVLRRGNTLYRPWWGGRPTITTSSD